MASRSYEFAMGLIAASDRYRSQYLDRWREAVANFMLEPEYLMGGREKSPYRRGYVYRAAKNQIILKDPETHRVVMTYAAKLMRALFGSARREYVVADPVGYEDAVGRAPTVTRYLRHVFGLPHHYRALQQGVVEMLQVGTSVLEVGWNYQEREMLAQSVEEIGGVSARSEARVRIPAYDDVTIRNIDVEDFYPDPSRYLMTEMAGAGKRFRMNAFEARRKAAAGLYEKEAVERAIANLGRQTQSRPQESQLRSGLNQPQDTGGPPEFRDMTGFEVWSEVPWEEDGFSRRVITVLNDEVVRDDPWPLADPWLPFYPLIINPLPGRFYGLAPAEIIRWDQSLADAMKILLAEAIIRQVHPPVAFDPDAEPDVAALKAWKADAMIAVRGGPASIGALRYDANVFSGFQLLSGLKTSMQEASGAMGSLSGEEGPDREAATVGARRYEMALDRPELAARLLEEECLPPIALAVLRRAQQFETPEGLAHKIGEEPEATWLGDIMGEYDIRFVGSRQAMTRQVKLQALDRVLSYAGVVPTFQAVLPSMELAKWVIGELLELPEIALRVGQPDVMEANVAAMQAMGPGRAAGNGNMMPRAAEPAGLMPAQASGAGP